jgi:antitoxin (DNA-binding transcriptional repressor) of toxin-antitoxin stability system
VKEATIEQFAQNPQGFVRAAQQERVPVTDNGEPVALVVGVKHKDAEDWRLEESPEFWQMIEARRQRPTRPLESAMSELFPVTE